MENILNFVNMKKPWKEMAVVSLICVFMLTGCVSNKPIEGTEETYYGTVVDRAMSKVNEMDRFDKGRAYISIELEDGETMLFWFANGCESDASIGDFVHIESSIEENTNLLVATEIIVLPS